MTERVPFINRESELSQIEKLIGEWGTRRVLCIQALGGIGKTRLLQEVKKQFNTEVLITDIIDFDDLALRIPGNIEFAISRQIGQAVLDAYLQSLHAYHQMRRARTSAERLAQKRRQVHQTFIDSFNEFAAKRRVVLLLDTTDALEGTEVWNYVVDELSQLLQNVLIIVAGRNAQKLWEALRSRIGQDAQLINSDPQLQGDELLKKAKLAPLNSTASELYLSQKQQMLHVALEPGLANKLLLLAEGRPILIDLAVEWLARDIPLDWLVQDSLQELGKLSDADMESRREEFERQLVCRITQIRTFMDRLTLVMSRVYPLDVEMIAELLGMSQGKAETLFEEAKTYAFVKLLPDGRISLHDEMRRMVNKHVWDEVDPDKSRRRRDSKLAITCLLSKTQDLQAKLDQSESKEQEAPLQQDVMIDPFSTREVLKQQFWTLQIRSLRHRMYLDLDQGFEEFDRIFQDAFQGNESDFCIMLRETVKEYHDSLSPENQIRLDLTKGLLNILRGNRDTAMTDTALELEHLMELDPNQGFVEFDRLFQDVFNRGDSDFCLMLHKIVEGYRENLSKENRVRLDLSEGLLNILRGNLVAATKRIRTELGNLEQLKVKKNLDRTYNSLGYCYRLQGEWESAIESYERALSYSDQERDAGQIAETMNNIANVCRLSGDFERGLRYSKVSLKIREKLGHLLSIANSCYVRGMILWEIGNTAEAADHLARAREIYDRVNTPVRVAWVDRYVGYFHYLLGDSDVATVNLKKAEAVFRDRNAQGDLADTLNTLSRMVRSYKTLDDPEEAERFALEALKISEAISDDYKIAQCCLTLCVLYFRWGKEFYGKAQEYYDKGFPIARDGNYVNLLSRYQRTLANRTYDEGHEVYDTDDIVPAIRKWDQAFENYLEECLISASYKTIRFDRALSKIAQQLMGLPTQHLTRKYSDYLIEQWKKRGLHHQYPELISECEQIKAFLNEPDEQVMAQLARAQKDLLAMGKWDQVILASQQALEHAHTYLHSFDTVFALNSQAYALRQLGRFVDARRLCSQSIHIAEKKSEKVAVAQSHYVMGTIQWIIGNTAEAAISFRRAGRLFIELNDDLWLARVRRYEGFLYFRIGNLEKALELLGEARICFEEFEQFADLADALAVESRVLTKFGEYEQAKEKAEQANKLAREIGNNYVVAETLITLFRLNSLLGQNAQESDAFELAARFFETAQQCLLEGDQIARQFGFDLLKSVYEATFGHIAFDKGRWGQAFEHYVAAMERGAKFSYARLHRTMDPCIDRLVKLPTNLIGYYADHVIREWEAREMDAEFPDVVNVFRLVKEYREYVSQA